MNDQAPAIERHGAAATEAATTSRRTRSIVIAAVAGALVVIAACWLLLEGRDQSPDTEPPAAVSANEAPAAAAAAAQIAQPASGEPDASRADTEQATDSRRESVSPAPPAGLTAPGARDAAPLPAPAAAGDAPAIATPSDFSDASAADPRAAGHWAIPSAETFAIFGLIADAWRSGRFSPELFSAIEQRSATIHSTTSTPGVELLGKWIDGGRALIAGDREQARAIAGEFLALEKPPDWVTLLPARFLARHPGATPDWQVALFWGDPRNEARSLVEAAIAASPDDRNLTLASAVVDHLDGRHAEAARQAMALEPQLHQGRPRRVVARFVGDQLLWSGQFEAAISWYKRLLMNPDRTEIGAVLRTLSQEGGPQMVARACAAGFAPACEAGRNPGGPRARRARPQP